MMNEAAYAEANRTYWTHRAPSYGDVNRKSLQSWQKFQVSCPSVKKPKVNVAC